MSVWQNSTMLFDFPEPPPIGTILLLDDQDYEFRGTTPYVKEDGDEIEILVWESGCADCGDPFTTSTMLQAKGMARRCKLHRAPLKPVRKGKRKYRKVKVTILYL